RHFWQLRFGAALGLYPQLGLDFGEVRTIRGRLYGSTLSRIAPAVAHVYHGAVVASRRFLEQLQREHPSRPQPPLSDMIQEFKVYGSVAQPMDALVLAAGTEEDES